MTGSKVAVVTAGGSGMGADAARRLSADGFGVAILSSSGKGEALAESLGGVGVTGSNRSAEDLGRLVDLTMARWGRIDVLVNSAGHGPRAPLLDITDEDWHLGLDTYLLNVVRPTRLVTPIMQQQGSGAIVNISTLFAFEPDPGFPTSGVFRAGLAAFSKLFADRYAAEKIRMNNVLPGFIDSLPERDASRAHPHGPLRADGGSVRPRGLPCVGAFELHHRAEYSHRRRRDPVGLNRRRVGCGTRSFPCPSKRAMGGPQGEASPQRRRAWRSKKATSFSLSRAAPPWW